MNEVVWKRLWFRSFSETLFLEGNAEVGGADGE